jgi:GNAT superfamily N-acetyltransferase
MILHEIHDLSDKKVVSILQQGLSKITDPTHLQNYHPDFAEHNGNLFYILNKGRYLKGKYYVIEEDNKYICSAGWNEYELDSTIALMMTRLFVIPEYRKKFYAASHILPKALAEAKEYKHIWMSMNEHNKTLYLGFDRLHKGKRSGLFDYWPEIWSKFSPIGKRDIYYTEQYVVEYRND